jgi:acyl carrier protein
MNASEAEIKIHVVKYLMEKLESSGIGRHDLDDGIDLVGSGLISSLGFIELLASVENQFGIEIDFEDRDPSEFTTFTGFVKLAADTVRAKNG